MTEEHKTIIVFRHMPYKADKEDKSFWQLRGKLDTPSYGRTLMEIKRFLFETNCAVKEIHSTTILRARETAVGLADSIEINSERPRIVFSEKIDPEIEKWEKINWSKDYLSVLSVEAMYEANSLSKPLLQEEGAKLLEYLNNMLKEMEEGEGNIIVTHSPIIQALISAFKEDWDTIPETIDKGTSIGFVFDNENRLVEIKYLHLRFTGP